MRSVALRKLGCVISIAVAAGCCFAASRASQAAERADGRPTAAQPASTTKIAYNRNALVDSVIVGDVAMALTRAGTLLRFTLPDVTLTGEHSGVSPITCISQSGGSVIAVAADGSIYKVDGRTMRLEAAGRVRGRPLWVSPIERARGSERLAIVTETTVRRTEQVAGKPRTFDAKVLTVKIFPRGKSFRLEGDYLGLSHFALLGEQLWIGLDRGEWGGRLGHLDLASGRQQWFDSSPIYGFNVIGDRVYAVGGGMHLTLTSAFIATVDAQGPTLLYKQDNRAEKLPTDRPLLPISAVLPDTASDDLFVFSHGQVFRVDSKFTRWVDEAFLDLEYGNGRPDAIGYLPSIVRVHPLPAGRRFLVATSLNGYLVLDEGKTLSKALPHQPAATEFDKVVPFESGIAFGKQVFDGVDWKQLPVFPADPPGQCLDEAYVTSGGDGSLLVGAESCENGMHVLSRWRQGLTQVVHRWEADGLLRDIMATPDGAIWKLGSEHVSRLEDGEWVNVELGPAQEPHDAAAGSRFGLNDAIFFQELVSDGGPPWFMVCRRLGLTPMVDETRLVKLDYDREFRSARLVGVKLDERDKLEVYDAVPFGPSRLLVATSAGLKFFDTDRGVVSHGGIPLPRGDVRTLAKDRRGRIWMGGSGLWMLDDHELIEMGSRLPTTGCEIETLAADPRTDGVVMLLERGMVVFMSAR